MAALIADELRRRGIDVILVGGGAVEFYTEGGFTTQDIDFVSVDPPAVIRRAMVNLGFRQAGRGFVFSDPPIFVEFPGGALDPPAATVDVKIAGCDLKLISREGIFIDRLRALTYWKMERDAAQVVELLLIHGDQMDWRLINRICREDTQVIKKLQAVRRLAKRVVAGRALPDDLSKLVGG